VQSAPPAELPPAVRPALATGLIAVLAGLAGGVVTGLLSISAAVIATAGYLVGAALVAGHWRGLVFGAANAVTLSRLVGGCWVAALTVEAALRGLSVSERLLIVAVATLCLILDGVDGRVARSRGEVSEFGARFDVETDAVLLLCLSLVVPILGVAGWWVVLLSGLRYGYVLAAVFLPVLRVPIDPTYAAKVICVFAQAALILALAVDLVNPGWPAVALLSTALGCLIWSFARDVRRQLRQYAAARVPVA
jgi:phosphatidylglycerophosphate synthase